MIHQIGTGLQKEDEHMRKIIESTSDSQEASCFDASTQAAGWRSV